MIPLLKITWIWKIFISCFRETTKNYNLAYTSEYEHMRVCCYQQNRILHRYQTENAKKITQLDSAIFTTKLGCAFINMLLKSSPFVWGEYPLAARAFQYYRAIYDVTIGLTSMTQSARVPATRLPATVKRLKKYQSILHKYGGQACVIVDDFN